MYERSTESVFSASPLSDLNGTFTFAMLVGFYLIYHNLRSGDRIYMKVDTGEPCMSVLVEFDTNNGLLT
jgi:F0F1-type ATP synthase membrane subunit a